MTTRKRRRRYTKPSLAFSEPCSCIGCRLEFRHEFALKIHWSYHDNKPHARPRTVRAGRHVVMATSGVIRGRAAEP